MPETDLLEEARKPWNFGRNIDWNPDLHPRDRLGRFRDVFKSILAMDKGTFKDLGDIVKDAPNIESLMVWRTPAGWEVRGRGRSGPIGGLITPKHLEENDRAFEDLLKAINVLEPFDGWIDEGGTTCPHCGAPNPKGGYLPGHQLAEKFKQGLRKRRDIAFEVVDDLIDYNTPDFVKRDRVFPRVPAKVWYNAVNGAVRDDEPRFIYFDNSSGQHLITDQMYFKGDNRPDFNPNFDGNLVLRGLATERGEYRPIEDFETRSLPDSPEYDWQPTDDPNVLVSSDGKFTQRDGSVVDNETGEVVNPPDFEQFERTEVNNVLRDADTDFADREGRTPPPLSQRTPDASGPTARERRREEALARRAEREAIADAAAYENLPSVAQKRDDKAVAEMKERQAKTSAVPESPDEIDAPAMTNAEVLRLAKVKKEAEKRTRKYQTADELSFKKVKDKNKPWLWASEDGRFGIIDISLHPTLREKMWGERDGQQRFILVDYKGSKDGKGKEINRFRKSSYAVGAAKRKLDAEFAMKEANRRKKEAEQAGDEDFDRDAERDKILKQLLSGRQGKDYGNLPDEPDATPRVQEDNQDAPEAQEAPDATPEAPEEAPVDMPEGTPESEPVSEDPADVIDTPENPPVGDVPDGYDVRYNPATGEYHVLYHPNNDNESIDLGQHGSMDDAVDAANTHRSDAGDLPSVETEDDEPDVSNEETSNYYERIYRENYDTINEPDDDDLPTVISFSNGGYADDGLGGGYLIKRKIDPETKRSVFTLLHMSHSKNGWAYNVRDRNWRPADEDASIEWTELGRVIPEVGLGWEKREKADNELKAIALGDARKRHAEVLGLDVEEKSISEPAPPVESSKPEISEYDFGWEPFKDLNNVFVSADGKYRLSRNIDGRNWDITNTDTGELMIRRPGRQSAEKELALRLSNDSVAPSKPVKKDEEIVEETKIIPSKTNEEAAWENILDAIKLSGDSNEEVYIWFDARENPNQKGRARGYDIGPEMPSAKGVIAIAKVKDEKGSKKKARVGLFGNMGIPDAYRDPDKNDEPIFDVQSITPDERLESGISRDVLDANVQEAEIYYPPLNDMPDVDMSNNVESIRQIQNAYGYDETHAGLMDERSIDLTTPLPLTVPEQQFDSELDNFLNDNSKRKWNLAKVLALTGSLGKMVLHKGRTHHTLEMNIAGRRSVVHTTRRPSRGWIHGQLAWAENREPMRPLKITEEMGREIASASPEDRGMFNEYEYDAARMLNFKGGQILEALESDFGMAPGDTRFNREFVFSSDTGRVAGFLSFDFTGHSRVTIDQDLTDPDSKVYRQLTALGLDPDYVIAQTLLHESIHGLTMRDSSVMDRVANTNLLGWEEGAVEAYVVHKFPEIADRIGLDPKMADVMGKLLAKRSDYKPWMQAYEGIRKSLGMSPDEFYIPLLKSDPAERRRYLEQIGQQIPDAKRRDNFLNKVLPRNAKYLDEHYTQAKGEPAGVRLKEPPRLNSGINFQVELPSWLSLGESPDHSGTNWMDEEYGNAKQIAQQWGLDLDTFIGDLFPKFDAAEDKQYRDFLDGATVSVIPNAEFSPGENPNTMRVDVRDKSGQLVMRRTLNRNGSVYHDEFVLPDDAPDGLGRRLINQQINTYTQHGVSHVDVYAGYSLGGYVWARMGFAPKENEGAQPRRFMQHVLAEFGQDREDLPRNLLPDGVPARWYRGVGDRRRDFYTGALTAFDDWVSGRAIKFGETHKGRKRGEKIDLPDDQIEGLREVLKANLNAARKKLEDLVQREDLNGIARFKFEWDEDLVNALDMGHLMKESKIKKRPAIYDDFIDHSDIFEDEGIYDAHDPAEYVMKSLDTSYMEFNGKSLMVGGESKVINEGWTYPLRLTLDPESKSWADYVNYMHLKGLETLTPKGGG